ncbi:MAG TPA: hypothetical protein VLP43_08720 [Solirubrobacteraceae bacterium]|nr:hypothetical protein [Solirubrobacteraceae bacterium]
MCWRAICTGLTLGLMVATAAPASGRATPPSGRATPPCGPPGASTLAADAQARVYSSGGVFGCTRGNPASVPLGGSTNSCLGSALIGPVALAGATAAYAAERCGVDTGSTSVAVRRLSDGRQLVSVPAGSPPAPESYTSVTAIVVRSGGGVAWIAVSRSLGRPHANIEVWRVTHGATRRLDTGPGVAQHSLRLHGGCLTWRDRNRTRSATLG